MRKLISIPLALALAPYACSSSPTAHLPDAKVGDGGGGGGSDSGGGGPATVTVTMQNFPSMPTKYNVVAAYRDGSGAWQAAPAPAGGVYTMTIDSGVWSFAFACTSPITEVAPGGVGDVLLIGATTAERTSFAYPVPAKCTDAGAITPIAVTGTVSGLQTGAPIQYFAQFGAQCAPLTQVIGTAGGIYDFKLTLPKGATKDLIITEAAAGSGSATAACPTTFTATQAMDDYAFYVNPAAGSNAMTAAIAYTGTATNRSTVTATPPAITETTLYSQNGTVAQLAVSEATPFSTVGLGAGSATDVYLELAAGSDGAGGLVESEAWVAAPAAYTFAPPAGLGGVTATETGSVPYPMLKATWPAYPGVTAYTWTATQATTGTAWGAFLSPGYVGASPQFTMPDLSGIPGWITNFGFVATDTVTVDAVGLVSSAGISDTPFQTPAPAGTTRTRATSATTIAP